MDKHRIRRGAITLLLICIACASHGASQDLFTTYQQALDQDALLKRALAQRNANREAMPLAISNMLPSINVVGQSSSNDPAITAAPDFGTSNAANRIVREHNYVVSATQPLLDLQSWIGVTQANFIVDKADATYTYAEQSLILRTAQAYFDVLNALDNLDFATAEKNALEAELHQVQEKFNVGLIAITDLNDFRARYDFSVAQEIQSLNNLENSKEELRVITGNAIDMLIPLKPVMPLESPEPADIDTWESFAQDNNPLLAATRFDMESQRANVEVQRAQHYPTLNVQGAYGQSHGGLITNPDGNSDIGWELLFQAQMNLYAGGGIQASVNRAQYTYEDARYAYEEARRETVSNTRIAYRGVLNAIAQVNALHQAVVSAQTALDANHAAYEVGAKTTLDVLNSLSNLYDQQRNFATARYAYIINLLALKQSAGNLSMQDIERVNHWLMLDTTP